MKEAATLAVWPVDRVWRSGATLALLLIASGCVEAPAQNAQKEALAKAPTLGLHGNGLRIVERNHGVTRLIQFGLPMSETLERLEPAFVQVEAPLPDVCGAQEIPVEVTHTDQGMMLLFREDRFAGWIAHGDSLLTTDRGVGIGSPRAQLDHLRARVESTRYGTQFTIGPPSSGLGGLLGSNGPGAKVAVLWSGLSCPISIAELEAPESPSTDG